MKLKEKCKAFFTGRSAPGAAVTALVIGIVILVNVIVYALDVAFGLYLYRPELQNLTLSDAPAEILAPAMAEGKEASVIFCSDRTDVAASSTGAFALRTAENLAEAFPDFFHVAFVNVIVEPGKVDPYTTDEDGNATTLSERSVIFKSGGVDYAAGDHYRVLTDNATTTGYSNFFSVNSQGVTRAYMGEEVFVSMINWVLTDEHPRAYFTVSHGETADISLSNMLACAGYRVSSIDLRKQEIPTDAGVVFISAPQSDFEQSSVASGVRSEVDRLRDYLDRGGRIYVSIDPYLKNNLPVLSGILAEYGITLMTSEVEGRTVRAIVRDGEGGLTANGVTLSCLLASDAAGVSDTVRETSRAGVLLSSAAPLILTGEAKPLLLSSSSATAEVGGTVVDRAGSYAVAAYSQKTVGDKTSTVVVVPSVYLTAADAIVTEGYANRTFLYAVTERLFGQSHLPYGCKISRVNNTTLENFTMGRAHRITALLVAVPVLIAAAGVVVLIRRKNR